MLKHEPGWDSVCIEFGDLSPIPIRGVRVSYRGTTDSHPQIQTFGNSGETSQKDFKIRGLPGPLVKMTFRSKRSLMGLREGGNWENWDCDPQRIWNSKRSVKREGGGLDNVMKNICILQKHTIFIYANKTVSG